MDALVFAAAAVAVGFGDGVLAAAVEAGASVVSNAIELVAATAMANADSLSFIGRNFSRARAHGLPERANEGHPDDVANVAA
ncbi:MAG: hypothetical protein WAN39_08380 [Candidatus Cybelea sp.]